MNDEQRRLVANRLRECRGGWSSGECYYTIIQALGLPDTSREDGGHALYSALADLIDPDCREVARPPRPVDREALLAIADEIDAAYVEAAQMLGLPRAADEGTVFSRRIREACGEVVA